MPLVAGVTFRRVGKVYYFDPGDLKLREGDFVIAETARGVEFGEIVLEPREIPEEELVAPLKKIVRVADGDDMNREAANREREKHAYEVCERKIAEHNLPMKLLEAEYAFDGSQVTISFCADGRVDFRELVKDVAGALKTKVQLHQIGVRDEAKLIGGYGGCGRPLCCATFLSNFDPISMKMAKDQSLFLNPAKFSGVCGKLMCCLRYEHEHYKLSQKRLPAVGAVVPLEKGTGRVIDVNVISNIITVQTEDDVQLHIPASQIHLEGLCRRHGVGCNMSEKHCECLIAGDLDAFEITDDTTTEVDEEHEVHTDDTPILVDEDEIIASNAISGVKWREPRGSVPDNESDKPDQPNSEEQKSKPHGNGGNGNRHPKGGSRPNGSRNNGNNRNPNRQRNQNNRRSGNGPETKE